jgi:hypothetical protein
MQINVNGQNYTRWEDVPAEVRQQLAATLPDADKNGIPDLFEGNLSGLPAGAQTFASSSIMVNGQPVQSAADLPPEIQAKLQQALGMIGPMFGTPPAPGIPAAPGTPAAATAVPPNAPWPLQPGQVMLNGVPTTVGDATPPAKKGFLRRLFGG